MWETSIHTCWIILVGLGQGFFLFVHSYLLVSVSFLLLKDYNSLIKLLLQKMEKETLYSLSKSVGPVCGGLENGMTTQSSILAWGIPRTEEPGRLQSMDHKRVGHD